RVLLVGAGVGLDRRHDVLAHDALTGAERRGGRVAVLVVGRDAVVAGATDERVPRRAGARAGDGGPGGDGLVLAADLVPVVDGAVHEDVVELRLGQVGGRRRGLAVPTDPGERVLGEGHEPEGRVGVAEAGQVALEPDV